MRKVDKHFAATVFLVSTEPSPRVLLLFHKKLNTWLPAGGHQESDENPVEAAYREVLEETGIDISQYIPKIKQLDEHIKLLPRPDFLLEEEIPKHKEVPMHYHLDNIYVVRVPYKEPVIKPDEHTEVKWFSKDELSKLSLFINVRKITDEILR
jgi:8-oxo-dGTP diphosphatase